MTGLTRSDDRPLRERVLHELEATRRRTLALVDGLSEEDQRAQHSRLMSPLIWDLAHVGNFEEQWLLRALDGRPTVDEHHDLLYNAFEHPRWERPDLPLLGPSQARDYIAEIRDSVLTLLDRIDFDDENHLLHRGFVYGMTVQHEQQHDETMLATHQLMGDRAMTPPGTRPAPGTEPIGPAEVKVDGRRVVIGTSDHPWALDNERPAHEIEVAPFWIDTTPTTNRSFLAFIEGGGYDEPGCWSPRGWSWRRQERLEHPQFWRRDPDGSWSRLRFGRWDLIDLDEPVQHVCWYEAEAFTRWAGKRLPTETEWETAATWHPATGKRGYPWGDDEPTLGQANLGQVHDGPAPVGAFPGGVSPWGCHQMVGDVWEWTASDFHGHPGFRSFPYKEYSEVFFGAEYKVLRGGSWATSPTAVRGTFRNWDFPIRRQIFCGFRGARDAE